MKMKLLWDKLLALLLIALPASGQVKYDEILQGPGANWLTYHGDYQGSRHSRLKQITRDNVVKLVPKWTYHVEGATHLEAAPLVSNGVMYVTNTNEVDALDARTGAVQAWRAPAQAESGNTVTTSLPSRAPIAAWRYWVTGSSS